MGCQDCGAELRSSKQKFCDECRRKKQNAAVKLCNKRRYDNDPEFRKDMIRRTLEWENRHPERHWAYTAIKNHKVNGTNILFSIDQLEELALQTKICHYCGIFLKYGKKGKKGFDIHSPSMDNIKGKPALLINDVQIICAQCNSAKAKMSSEQFADWIEKVHFHIYPDNKKDSDVILFRESLIEFGKLHNIKKEDIIPDRLNLHYGNGLLSWCLRTLWVYAYDSKAPELFEELKSTHPILNRNV